MIKLENGNFFQYETSGKFSGEETWCHPDRIIYSHELIFMLEGKAFIEEDHKKYELEENNMLILEPGKRHMGYAKSSPPVAFYWLHFNTDMTLPFKFKSDGEIYNLKHLLKMLLHIANTPSYPPESAEATALMIFYELTYLGNAPQNSKRAFVGEVTEYVRINTARNLTVADTAAHFGYNPDYLGKLFKSTCGVGLKEYIASEKMKNAKDLLLTSNLSVKEIAAKLGFSHENLFIKFFLYHEKLSPSRFRDQYFNTHMNNK